MKAPRTPEKQAQRDAALIRLARAVHLNVHRDGTRTFSVRGGARPHQVILGKDGDSCDCEDFQFGNRTYCKHLLAVRLKEGDQRVIGALRRIVPMPSRSQRARR